MQDCGGTKGKFSYKGSTDSRVFVCMSDGQGLYPVCQGRVICHFTLGLITEGIVAPGSEEVQGFLYPAYFPTSPPKLSKLYRWTL